MHPTRSQTDDDAEMALEDGLQHLTAGTHIMTEQLRKSTLGHFYYRIMQDLLPSLQKSGLTANQMTFIGVMVALLVPFGFYLHPALGLVLMVVSGVADSMDGMLARRTAGCSAFGAFLDSSLDRLSDFFYLMGFWTLFWQQPGQLAATMIVFAALLFTQSISYVKARSESLGVACAVGLMERGLRVVYLIAWALALVIFARHKEIVLWGGLLMYCALTLTTLLQRIRHVRQRLQGAAADCDPVVNS